ncbi:YsnF/AvaK domain-containing protein [Nitrospira sp. Nam74]
MATIVTGLFDEQQEAVRAQAALERIGIAPPQIHFTRSADAEMTSNRGGNWWDRLKEMFGMGVDQEDPPYYHEGLRRGGTLLSAQADDSRVDEVAGIFADHNAVDIDTRAHEWRSAGWNPTEQIAIPVVEEELAIGKRVVRRGGVRIYTAVTEQPVEESVTLHEEQVEVTRRPANRAATASDFRASETPIEITETAEEPIVSKQAKVVEEVVVNKTDTERTETVRDTVRRKDVDVEQAS